MNEKERKPPIAAQNERKVGIELITTVFSTRAFRHEFSAFFVFGWGFVSLC